jgi:tRNA-Thr(GGU) m(6)t(6)A37 methyltransferase TsaA
MDKEEILFKPIGTIHSPFKEPRGTPVQPTAAMGIAGTVEVFPQYAAGLKDIDGFSHVILLYQMHYSRRFSLVVKPFLDNVTHGVFATRAPARPNAIGLSVVSLSKVEDNILHVQNVDIVDSTPLIDIKPYVPQFDHQQPCEIGWMGENIGKLTDICDDGRFII